MVLRRKVDLQGPEPLEGVKTSSHLARLYAHQEIARLLPEGAGPARDKAVAMASLFQLVTPVSGAVVLENAGQYAAAGLQPVDVATVPGVPEPEMVWLAVAGLVILILQVRPWQYLKLRRRIS